MPKRNFTLDLCLLISYFKLQLKYWAVNKEIKKRGKADRKAYTEKLANEAKHAASVQDMQVKTLAGKFQSPDILVKD